ncbi:hypothetical protein RUM43_012987 [Polyplax serrata]|uniref:Uncharacterized protein n=1 Tax=Polyplax serrata TaxID=468196 RepID=A0AAN8P254_POLSC
MGPIKLLGLLVVLISICSTSGFLYPDDDSVIPYSTIRMRRRLFAKRRHRNICNLENDEKNNEKLREVVGKSDFVFTGKVVNYHVEEEPKKLKKRDNDRREKHRRLKRPRGGSSKRKGPPQMTTPAELATDATPADVRNTIDVNLSLERPDKAEMFVVEVKRVIKGAEELSGVDRVVVRVPKEFVSGLEITSDPRLNTNCVEFHPVLKVRQTAILLTRKLNGNKFLELTYFPVAMTLRHLDRVDAAVTGRIVLLTTFN